MIASVAGDTEVAACGPAAIRVVARTGDRERDWGLVHALARWLVDEGESVGISGLIPTYDSLLVEFDPALSSTQEVGTLTTLGLECVQKNALELPPARHFDVPVFYGGEDGPDLEFVASLMGWSTDELIDAHTAKTYTIRCFGSPAASPMMDAPSLPKPVPRLSSPRANVPAGVVSLAGRQAVIAPAAAPGGWRVIGRTPLELLRREQDPPVPYRPGDTLRFHRIGWDEFERLRGRILEQAT